MSHGSAPPTGGTMEAMLALVAFISNPRYIDRVKELQAAQEGYDESYEQNTRRYNEAEASIRKLEEAKAALEADQEEFETLKRGHEESAARLMEELVTRENALKDGERKLAADKEEFLYSSAEKSNELLHRETALKEREANVNSRDIASVALQQSLNKRLAKLKAAMGE